MNDAPVAKSWNLPQRLKFARVGAGLDQARLAELVGTARASVSNYERGLAEPSASVFVRWANVTGVTLEWLAEGVEVTEQLQINYWLFASEFSIPDSPSEMIEGWARAELGRAQIDTNAA